jgi:hypothetical protein
VNGVLREGDITRRPESHSLDFVVIGRSLRSAAWTPGPDFVTELNRPDCRAFRPRSTNSWAGVRARISRRGAWRWSCAARCGDLGCGSQLTAALEIGDAEVCWSDFSARRVAQSDGLPEHPLRSGVAHYEFRLFDARGASSPIAPRRSLVDSSRSRASRPDF